MDCSCAPMLQFFSVASDGAKTAPNLEPRFLVIFSHFEEGQRRQICMDLDDVLAVCQRTGCALRCSKRFVVPSVGGATRFANLRPKFSKTQKKSAAELCQIGLLRMVTVEIVINCTRVMGVRVTISCRYALSLLGRCFCFQFHLLSININFHCFPHGLRTLPSSFHTNLHSSPCNSSSPPSPV